MEEQIRILIDFSRYSNNMMQKIAQRQASAPTGHLREKRKNGKVSYYRHFDAKTPLKYLNKTQAPLIAELAQKRYDQQAYDLVKMKKAAVDKCIEILKKADEKKLATIYNNFPPELRPLIKTVSSYQEDFAKKWQARVYKKSTLKVDTNFKTKRGELVRSKSELIIANKLFDEGIPYHYETLLSIDIFLTYSPDFLVLNTRTKKEYYWEHFGRMSDPKYLDETLCKLENYAEKGVVQGINLITTFECGEHPLNTLYLDKIIETYLK